MNLRWALQDHFGPRFRRDADDLPFNRPPAEVRRRALRDAVRNAWRPPREVDCVHFLPLKYRFVRGAVFTTWLRDPLERLGSQYHYWRRTLRDGAGALHRRMVEEDWSFERFVLGPEMRNAYHRLFWGFPFRRFAFVGITEHYDDDFREFCRRFLGREAEPEARNRNPEAPRSYFEDDPELKRRAEAWHAADVSLYRRALRAREERLRRRGAGAA